MIASGLDSASAALYTSTVLHNPSQAVECLPPLPLHLSYHGNTLFFFMQSHYLESQCDLQAYITSQMSQHAHQEGSMMKWKKHSIWYQIEQVQFLHLPLPNCMSHKLFYLSKPQFLPLTNRDQSTYLGGLL